MPPRGNVATERSIETLVVVTIPFGPLPINMFETFKVKKVAPALVLNDTYIAPIVADMVVSFSLLCIAIIFFQGLH